MHYYSMSTNTGDDYRVRGELVCGAGERVWETGGYYSPIEGTSKQGRYVYGTQDRAGVRMSERLKVRNGGRIEHCQCMHTSVGQRAAGRDHKSR